MNPAKYDITLYQGDTYHGPLITLPSFVPFGGPPDLTGCDLVAQIRDKDEPTGALLGEFDVEVVDPAARQIRPNMTYENTGDMSKGGFWDLQVVWLSEDWMGTPLKGRVTVNMGPTEP